MEAAVAGLAAFILPDQRLVVLALAFLEVAEDLERVDPGPQLHLGRDVGRPLDGEDPLPILLDQAQLEVGLPLGVGGRRRSLTLGVALRKGGEEDRDDQRRRGHD
jgi:hypothetical protein